MVLVGGGRLSFDVVGFSKLAAKVSVVAWVTTLTPVVLAGLPDTKDSTRLPA